MRNFVKLFENQNIHTVLIFPPQFTEETAERWLDQMNEKYGVDYRPAPNVYSEILSIFGHTSDKFTGEYEVIGPETVVTKMQEALRRLSDTAAPPHKIAIKIYELSTQGGLKLEDAIMQCMRKYEKTFDEMCHIAITEFDDELAYDYPELAEQIKRLQAGLGQ